MKEMVKNKTKEKTENKNMDESEATKSERDYTKKRVGLPASLLAFVFIVFRSCA